MKLQRLQKTVYFKMNHYNIHVILAATPATYMPLPAIILHTYLIDILLCPYIILFQPY